MMERMRDFVKLLPSLPYEKRERDIAYLMELKEENLLLPFYTESGLAGSMNYRITNDVHGGWDSPLSQIRGTFTGHFLSAAAYICRETGHGRLKAKADYIVDEIYKCQQANGGGWAFPIPEKYLYGIKRGQHFWAPQYVCHKIMMGLLDMYLLTGNQQAMSILDGCSEWFYLFTEDISRETMDRMMDLEETGGIMELWADLYAVTRKEKHLELMRRYERPKLTEPLYQGKDVLTNMHANATVAEIHGCARAYEVTGEERYRIIAENYWDLAVTKRGCFATGGGTDGEIWTPPGRQSARLSDMNQEHCVVYNMIRLADYLYRFSGKKEYLDYIELNIENGLFAQGFWRARTLDGACEPREADSGIVCYYLPLAANSVKKWGRKTEDFWCCHCTAVQANTKYSEWIYYRDEEQITIAQYIPSVMELSCQDTEMKIQLTEDDLGGDCIEIKEVALEIKELPRYRQFLLEIHAGQPVLQKFRFRIPGWTAGKMQIWVNGEECSFEESEGYAVIEKTWLEDRIVVRIPKELRCQPLADAPDTVAFLDGPVLLAGLTGEERTLYGDRNRPETILTPHHEREWNYWRGDYRTVNQMKGIYFRPIKEIGRETYTVYFPVRRFPGEHVKKQVSPPLRRSREELEAEAEAGDLQAQAVLGGEWLFGHYGGPDYEKALFWSGKAAAQGNEMAMTNLAIQYLHGYGVKEDTEKALELLSQAMEKGYFKAFRHYGLCCAEGRGIEKSMEKAVRYYRMGAEKGDITSQFLLGECLEKGNGTEKDLEQAIFWYRRSAARGDEISEPAIKALERLKDFVKET